MSFTLEYEQEEDGRWLGEVPQLPGVLMYGATPDEVMARAEALALRVLAERLEEGEAGPEPISISFATPAGADSDRAG
jgi:predicted RNase H-like HicB family nuclease